MSFRPTWSSPALHKLAQFDASHEPTATHIGRGSHKNDEKVLRIGPVRDRQAQTGEKMTVWQQECCLQLEKRLLRGK